MLLHPELAAGRTYQDLLPQGLGILRCLPGVLTAADCKALIADLEAKGFAPTGYLYPPSYRDNDRLVFDDPDLADLLGKALHQHLPQQIDQARLDGLNPRFRSCRYRNGQSFCRHRDGVYYQSPTVFSRLTFMVYLNDASEFSGGRTRFYADRASLQPLVEVLPRAGDLLVFSHDLWHDGEAVTSGCKYVLRSDILYHCQPGETIPVPGSPDSEHPRLERKETAHAGYLWKVTTLGSSLASGGRDGRIRIEAPGTRPQFLTGHALSVTALAAASDGNLWSGSRDQSLQIWHRQNREWQSQKHWQAHQGAVLSLTAFAGQEAGVASGGADGQIQLWDLSGQLLLSFAGPGGWVWDLVQSPQGDLLAAGESGQIQISRKGEVLTLLQAPVPQRALVVRPSGEILSGGADGQIRQWSQNRLQAAWQAHQGAVRALALLPNGRLASGGEDDQVRLWDLSSLVCLDTFPHDDFVSSLALTAQAQLVSGAYDGCLRWFSLNEALSG